MANQADTSAAEANGLGSSPADSNYFDKPVASVFTGVVHHIQRKILGKLLYAERLNYAKLRPAGIESNHFSYHLEQLLRDGLVQKQDKLYALTPLGLQFVDRLSQGEMVDRLQPHIVTAIALTNSAGQTLLYKRGFQPYIGRSGFPLGKIHYEETVAAAAARELQEKTGITNVALRHRGMAYVESKISGLTISKVLYHVFDGHSNAAPQQPNPERGTSMWADASTLAAHQLMPGFLHLQNLLAGTPPTKLFFAEFSEEMSSV